MKYYMKLLWMAAAFGILCIFGGTQNIEQLNLSDIACAMAMSDVLIFPAYIESAIYWYVPLLFFQVFWGTYLYNHFCTASVYFFSRSKSRVKWFITETARLYLYSILYLLIMMLSGIIFSCFFIDIHIQTTAFYIFLYYLLIYSLFLFATTLLINLLSICISSTVAFGIIEGIFFFGIAAHTFLGQFLEYEQVIQNPMLIKLNPFSHLVFSVHSSAFSNIDRLINGYNIDFDLNVTVLLYLVLSLAAVVFGIIVIKRYDFISLNKEME